MKKWFFILLMMMMSTSGFAQMPQSKLLRVSYNFGGMRMPEFGDFDLKRNADGGEVEFSFYHYRKEMKVKEVPDSVFDALRTIIEEERMYEYAKSYRLPPDIEEGMLDGFHWSFDAWFEGDEYLSSTGRHVTPDGKGLRRIEDCLSEAARIAVERLEQEAPTAP